MAKGTGLIGNFKGKVGNTVGYKLTDSNTGNTQGIRVYQPIVKNPKTSAQAEQRAKLAPINATYRALKMIIDRGYEGLPYGNKSRLAWLKKALKAQQMPWFVKGAVINMPVGCELTKGSLSGVPFTVYEDSLLFENGSFTAETAVDTIGKVSEALIGAFPQLKNGDQITLVLGASATDSLSFDIFSFVLDTTSKETVAGFDKAAGSISWSGAQGGSVGAVIVSREGANGEHLRSTTTLTVASTVSANAPYDATSKAAAINSYMSAASVNSDWAEESIQ